MVEIDRVAPITTRQKLWHTERACVRTFVMQWTLTQFTRQQQKLLELGTEQVGARRVSKRQRYESIEYIAASDVASIKCLDADGGDDNFLGHCEFGAGTRQRSGIALPVSEAAAYPCFSDLACPVLMPWTRGGRSRYSVERPSLHARLAEPCA